MTPTKIAFVSCAYATRRPVQPAWKQISAAQPDLLLMLGDNAYMSWKGSNWDFEALEQCYRAQFEVADFKALIESVPTLAIWDDHDCGPNDTLGTQAPPADLARTREMFDRWMGFALNNNRPHMYCSYDALPDVRVLALDVRTYRTASGVPGATVLGAQQEQWLWRNLDPAVTPQRKFTLLASGTGFSVGMEKHRLQDYPFASTLRSRLAYRAGNAAAGDVGRRALVLAGDVHYCTFKTHKTERLHEAISSGVACFRATTQDFTPASHADNWGLITIEGDQMHIDFHGNAMTKNPPRKTIDVPSWTIHKP